MRTHGREAGAVGAGETVGGWGDRGQMDAVVVDVEGAIEALMEVDAAARVADPLLVGRDVHDECSEPDGVVVGDEALVLEAEDVVEGPSPGPGRPGGVGSEGGTVKRRLCRAR